ncbi:MAG TPA: glutamate 5-kinase [Planctomycetaceae bacterium]|nr:glutamate 5-kinase [Planctomycetaceae bacterium]
MSAIPSLVRREVVQTAKTLVVKIGTNVLSKENDTLDDSRFDALAAQVHFVRQSGKRVVLVSSGAISAGIGLLELQKRPDDLPHLQAAAAVGQAHLIRKYDACLVPFGYRAAQLLLTANDFRRRARYLNVRNTLRTLFEYNAIPIVNENDTVSVEEIRFGDNDRLAALVTNLLESPLLVILSVIDGLYDGDPSDPTSKLVPLVETWDDALLKLATAGKSLRGTGGMQSKLEAARDATAVGENVIIADGRIPNVLERILAGHEVGTLFLARGESIPAWKRWIGYSLPPRGRLVLDDGARQAIAQRGRSLLAIGITSVHGEFTKGEVVSLVDQTGVEFARGLTNFGSHDARKIAGKRKNQIADILGSLPYDEVIHCDNLVVTVAFS